MSAPVIRADRLSKVYGRDRGVSDLTFEVGEGEVFGYLGPNGAGKTTTIRLLLDLIRPSSGRIELFGDGVRRAGACRAKVPRLPARRPAPVRAPHRPASTCATSPRCGACGDIGDGESLAERLELELDRPVRSLSKGNRQKVGLVQALMHRPALAVFDEPTSGLDPLVQQVVYELVAEATADGRTVFVSSHVLSEVQHIADRVALIREGRLQLVDSVETLRQRALTRVEVTFAKQRRRARSTTCRASTGWSAAGPVVRLTLEGSADPLVKALARFEVHALDSHEADWRVFLELYRRPADAR